MMMIVMVVMMMMWCMYACSCLCVHVCLQSCGVQGWLTSGLFLNCCAPLIQGFPCESEAHSFGSAGWPVSSRDPQSLAPLRECWGPHACMSSWQRHFPQFHLERLYILNPAIRQHSGKVRHADSVRITVALFQKALRGPFRLRHVLGHWSMASQVPRGHMSYL